VDQTQARGHVVERAGEVVFGALEVLEHRMVLAKATGDVTAGVPVAPRVQELVLERLRFGVVMVGQRGQ
jgi:hypothetical protein